MAGTVMIAISTFAGIDLRGEIIKVNPSLPHGWKQMDLSLRFKNTKYHFVISNSSVTITSDNDSEVTVFGNNHSVKKNNMVIFES